MERLPNLLVIGAMKCGTSSLHRYLGLHPEIAMSETKELNFFLPADAPEADRGPAELLAERSTAARGIDWYEGRFEPAPVRGESSVAYSFPWFGGVAAAIAGALGSPRLIYLVRDPIERMLSHRDQFASRDRRPLGEALTDPAGPYLQASSYATALAPYLERFDRDSLLILDQARLRAEREAALTEVFSFLGVDPAFRSPGLTGETNVSAGKGRAYRTAERVRSSRPGSAVAARLPRSARARAERALRRRRGATASGRTALEPALEAQLLALLEPEIAGLERITGWDLDRWRRPAERPPG
jgi:hypothetical protein